MALIGTSRAWAPRRNTLASTEGAAMTAARLHQVRPARLEKATATRTPVSTAPTRSSPIRTVE